MNLSVRFLAALLALLPWSLPAIAQPHTVAAVRADRTNLRAQPSKDAEVLASLHKGELLEVLGEELPAGQKEIWSRVVLPSSVLVWVHSPGLDKAGVVRNETVNFRAGPGKNYSIIGSLRRGDSVVILREFDNWLQIAPPKGSTAYVASRLLGSPEAPLPTPTVSTAPPAQKLRNTPEEPTPTTTSLLPPSGAVPEKALEGSADPAPNSPDAPTLQTPVPPRAKTSRDTPFPDPAWASIAKPVTPEQKPTAPAATAPPTPPPVAPVSTPTQVEKVSQKKTTPESAHAILAPQRTGSPRDQLKAGDRTTSYPLLTSDPDPGRPKPGSPPLAPREVIRDGVVRLTWSPQAPSDYELRSVYSGEGVLNYLYLEPQSDLKKFVGKQVRVQGEEYLDSRWQTPVLKVKTIELNP
ncbi:MAG: SH3 domain-containing protein [Verrucomicrobiota bacterium]